MAAAKVRLNADGTLSVKVGRAIEHVSIEGKTKAQVYDAVRYALISKDVRLEEAALTELLYHVVR